MHWHIFRAGLTAVALFAPCVVGAQQVTTAPTTPSVAQDPDEYAVRNFVLSTYVTGNVKELVIRDRTALLHSEIKRMPNFKRAPDAVADLEAKSRAEYPVEDEFSVNVPCTLLSKEAENELFHYPTDDRLDAEAFKKIQDGWRRFHRDHPDTWGLITISRVGFNPDKSLAVVYVGIHASMMIANGKGFLLVRKNGSWAIESEELIWFS
jgi:hypothetical protein